MSKKHQPQIKENAKNKIQIVEQQNQPFLKALQKRVRNINKKLTQIAELQLKDNLKPEQVEKVNRKPHLLEERTRLQETATFFRDTYAENIAVYRNAQLKQLETVARALAVYHHSEVKFEDRDKLVSLWNSLQQRDRTYSTINQSISALSTVLKDFANDRKLQKSLTAFIEQHGETVNQPAVIQQKIINQKIEEKQEVAVEQVVQQVTPEIVSVPVAEPVVVEPTPVIAKPEPKEVENVATKEQPKVIVESQPTPIINQQVAFAQAVKETHQTTQELKPKTNNREERPYTQARRRERKEGGQPPRQKKQYRPRYQERKPEFKEKDQQESNSSRSSPDRREFRQQEIKQLEEEGFIVVGKPKPKPKDPQQLRQYHNKQHGNKQHHYNGNK